MKTFTLWVLSVPVFVFTSLLPLPASGKQHIDSASPHVSAGHGASLPALHTPTPNANPQPAAVTPSLCNRTDAVEAAILDALTPSVTCQTATADQLGGITQLDLSNTNIGTLKSGDFANLTNLGTLDLRYARLTALPADIFSPLTNLTSLNLHSNQLASLPATLFNGLTKLQTLDLHNNWLTSLPTPTPPATGTTTYTGLLNHLTALQHLYLYGNRLSSLPAGLLAGLTNLTTLNFSNNRISPLPLSLHIAPASGSDLLTGPSVTAKIALPAGAPQALTIPLTITGGSLSSHNIGISKGATESTASFTITRTGSSTTVVSFGTLPMFIPYNPGPHKVSISGLTLSGTSLTLFNNSKPTFSATPAAATYEQNSRITPLQLPAATGGNGALTYSLTATASNGGTLDSSSNLPTGLAFDDQSRILSGTPTVTGTYSMTYKVQDADSSTGASDEDSRTFTLTVTAVEVLPHTPVCDRTTAVRDALVAAISGVSACAGATATHLLNITALNLASKSITSLKAGDFSGLPNLTNLQLQNNSIATLPAGLFADLDELVSLSLRDNLLTALPANIFQDLTYLRILWLHNNRLDSIDGAAFAGLNTLSELYLNNNRLTTLPATLFADLFSLTTLHLGQNRIATLPAPTGSAGTYSGLFNGLRSLKRLNLNSNRLTGLNGNSFRGLAELTHLSLRNNRLATLPTGNNGNSFLSDSSKLQSLWLYGNQLSSLPDGLFTGLDSLKEILLHSNAVATFTLPVKIEANPIPRQNNLRVTVRLPVPAPQSMSIKVTVDGSASSVYFQGGLVQEKSHSFFFQPGQTTPQSTARLQRSNSSSWVVLNVVTPLPDLGDKFTGLALAASPTLRSGGPSQTLSFGTTTVPPQTYAIGRPIATLALPTATASTGTPTITYTLSPATPGLTFSGTARTLTGTPTAANPSYEMTYTASSSGYRSASLRFSIAYVANTAPTFEANTTISDQTITKDEEIALRLPPAKNGNLPLTYELTGAIKAGTSAGTISNGLPAGLYFNAGERLLSGQPSALGSYTMTYKVTDLDGESATLPSFTLNIVVSQVDTAPTFSQSSIATQYFAQNLMAQPLQLPAASGGDGLLTYSLTPPVPGLTFNPDNRTLTGSATTLGTTSLTYKVADSDSNNAASDTATLIFDLQVYAAATFTDTSLHNSEQAHAVGRAGFSLQLPAATGGRGTLSYALTGTLPTGVTFTMATRTLAGTPTQVERRLLSWTVTDGEGFKTEAISFGVRINTPVTIAQAQYNFNLPEKLDGSTNAIELGEIVVVDPDPNDPLSATLSNLNNPNFNVRQAAPPSINFKLFYEGTGEDLGSLSGDTRTLPLTVSDGASTATTNITVTIIAANQQPVAEAGPDQTVIPTSVAAQRVTLAGSGTDPDNNSLTYAWTAPAAITLSEDTTTAPHFHPHIAAGAYSITLAVTDIPTYSVQPPLTGTDTVTITVGHGTPYFKNASNTVITAQTLSVTHGATAGANIGSPVLASDPNGGTIASYSLTDTTASSGHAANFQVSNGGQISVASGKTLSTVGDYAVTLTASKGSGATARSGAIALTLSVVASALPMLTAAISDQSLARGGSQTITLSNHFSDSDSTLTYTATSDNSNVLTVAVSSAGVLTLTAKSDAGGTANVEVTASDGASNVSDSFAVSVANNTPSISTAIPDQSNLTIGDSVAITLSDHFTDADTSDTLTYSHSLTPPSSAVATAAQATVGGKPTLTLTAAIKGSLTITVTATDNGGTASVSDAFDLTVTNTAPTTAGTIPTQSLALGSSGVAVADLSQYFNDAEGKSGLTYTASSSDTAKVTTSVTGAALTLAAPLNQAAGTATITVTATDNRAKTATQTFAANTTDTAPSFGANTIADRFHVQNQAITPFQMPAATGGNGTLAYSLSPTVPGLRLDPGTRTLTGTPTTLGTTSLTYSAADSDPNSANSDIATLSFDLQVYAQADLHQQQPEWQHPDPQPERFRLQPAAAHSHRRQRHPDLQPRRHPAAGTGLHSGDPNPRRHPQHSRQLPPDLESHRRPVGGHQPRLHRAHQHSSGLRLGPVQLQPQREQRRQHHRHRPRHPQRHRCGQRRQPDLEPEDRRQQQVPRGRQQPRPHRQAAIHRQRRGQGDHRQPEPERRGGGRTPARCRHSGGDGECDRRQREADRQRRQRPDRDADQRRQPARHPRRQGQHGSGERQPDLRLDSACRRHPAIGQHCASLVQPADHRRRLRFQPDRHRQRQHNAPEQRSGHSARHCRTRHALLQECQRHCHHQPNPVRQAGQRCRHLCRQPGAGQRPQRRHHRQLQPGGHHRQLRTRRQLPGQQRRPDQRRQRQDPEHPDQLRRHPDSGQGLRRHGAQRQHRPDHCSDSQRSARPVRRHSGAKLGKGSQLDHRPVQPLQRQRQHPQLQRHLRQQQRADRGGQQCRRAHPDRQIRRRRHRQRRSHRQRRHRQRQRQLRRDSGQQRPHGQHRHTGPEQPDHRRQRRHHPVRPLQRRRRQRHPHLQPQPDTPQQRSRHCRPSDCRRQTHPDPEPSQQGQPHRHRHRHRQRRHRLGQRFLRPDRDQHRTHHSRHHTDPESGIGQQRRGGGRPVAILQRRRGQEHPHLHRLLQRHQQGHDQRHRCRPDPRRPPQPSGGHRHHHRHRHRQPHQDRHPDLCRQHHRHRSQLRHHHRRPPPRAEPSHRHLPDARSHRRQWHPDLQPQPHSARPNFQRRQPHPDRHSHHPRHHQPDLQRRRLRPQLRQLRHRHPQLRPPGLCAGDLRQQQPGRQHPDPQPERFRLQPATAHSHRRQRHPDLQPRRHPAPGTGLHSGDPNPRRHPQHSRQLPPDLESHRRPVGGHQPRLHRAHQHSAGLRLGPVQLQPQREQRRQHQPHRPRHPQRHRRGQRRQPDLEPEDWRQRQVPRGRQQPRPHRQTAIHRQRREQGDHRQPEPERRGGGRTYGRRRHGGGDGECDRCQREADRQRRQRPDRDSRPATPASASPSTAGAARIRRATA